MTKRAASNYSKIYITHIFPLNIPNTRSTLLPLPPKEPNTQGTLKFPMILPLHLIPYIPRVQRSTIRMIIQIINLRIKGIRGEEMCNRTGSPSIRGINLGGGGLFPIIHIGPLLPPGILCM